MAAANSFTRDIDTIITDSLDYRVREAVDNIFVEHPLLDDLVKSRRNGYGLRVEVPLRYKKITTGKFLESDMETLAPEKKDTRTYAFYDWVEWGDTIAFSEKDILMNSGKGKFFDLVNSDIDTLLDSAHDKIATNLWKASAASYEVNSIPDLVHTAGTGTVGNIVSGTETWWKNQQIGSIGSFAQHGRAKMKKLYNDCSKGQNSKSPTHIYTDQTGFENYEALSETRERIILPEGGRASQEMGFDRLKFKNAWVYWSDYVSTDNSGPSTTTDGRWYFLNKNFFHLYILNGEWLEKGPLLEPTDQFAKSCKLHSVFQICVSGRRHLGVLHGVTYP